MKKNYFPAGFLLLGAAVFIACQSKKFVNPLEGHNDQKANIANVKLLTGTPYNNSFPGLNARPDNTIGHAFEVYDPDGVFKIFIFSSAVSGAPVLLTSFYRSNQTENIYILSNVISNSGLLSTKIAVLDMIGNSNTSTVELDTRVYAGEDETDALLQNYINSILQPASGAHTAIKSAVYNIFVNSVTNMYVSTNIPSGTTNYYRSTGIYFDARIVRGDDAKNYIHYVSSSIDEFDWFHSTNADYSNMALLIIGRDDNVTNSVNNFLITK
ncbi:MAG: hypothetical protein A2096_12045 [Spirochaetes bacterium GWF1_41_5]|nr:MAG: hypothetical protein A2096_12045 [Spirochaetes bacterium GWF1_41_5]HBE02972.1 hypothetical protein [Spirochaetia bacterium]